MGATSRAHTSTVTYEKTCTDSSSRPTQSYQLLEYLQETKIHILEDEIQIQLSRNPGTPPQLLGFAGAICCLLYYRALTCFLQLFFFPMHRGSNTNSVICLNPVFLVKRWFYLFIFLSIQKYLSIAADYHIPKLNCFSLLKKPFLISRCFIILPLPRDIL